ncbi:MAG: riboflavin synthase, partial [Chloroflexi bacterium]|nr:riboflavin synthase [Chloroflexota bacterium]
MFTGIVEEVGVVKASEPGALTIGARAVLKGATLGASIAVNGVCLTVAARDRASFTVHVVPETLARTNLGSLRPGDAVNLERALSFSSRLGGHLVQGHIECRGAVRSVEQDGEALLMSIEAPARYRKYIVPKGFIAVDGVSLTVIETHDGAFTVTLVPFTRRRTTLGDKRPGGAVNLETDIIARYVERLLQGKEVP